MGRAKVDKQGRRRLLWTLVALGAVLLVATFAKMSRLTTNPRSRVITVQRLLDDNTWSHAMTGDTTPYELSIDAVKIGDRLYSSKPPNYPAVMAGEALAIQAATGWEFYPHRIDYVRILTLLNQILPYLLMLGMAFGFIREQTDDPWTRWFTLVALGPGMLAFGYAATINNHTLSAALYTMGFLLVHRIRQQDRAPLWEFAVVGLLAGFAFSIELPSGGIALGLLFLLFLHDFRRSLAAAAAFALPLLASLGMYHYLSGDVRPFQLRSGLFRYAGSYWEEMEGIDAEKPGKGSYLFHMFLGFRGLFSMTPILLLGVWSLGKHILGGKQWLRTEWLALWPGILALVVFIIFNTWNYGGDCIGMRWFICFSPLLMLMAIPTIESLGRSVWGKVLSGALLVWSAVWNVQALADEAFVTGWFEQLWP